MTYLDYITAKIERFLHESNDCHMNPIITTQIQSILVIRRKGESIWGTNRSPGGGELRELMSRGAGEVAQEPRGVGRWCRTPGAVARRTPWAVARRGVGSH